MDKESIHRNVGKRRESVINELEKSKTLLEEERRAPPAHSLQPRQWALIKELEEKISLLEKEVSLLERQTAKGRT